MIYGLRLPSLLFRILVCLCLSQPCLATWSIILVNVRTGEVAIGSATCVAGYDLRQLTPVLVVGVGGAAAQSYVDQTGNNRLLIFNGFKQGLDPAQILVALAKADPFHQGRQYGIVDTKGRALGFTGTSAMVWKGHVTGKVGDIVYAIQGNVLTGKAVVDAAEQAVKTTKGDLAVKLMVAMQAARAKGGDGRCSCSPASPMACGAPPASFKKSAHIGYMIVARQGDKDGTCSAATGCASGSYYLNLNVVAGAAAPDPVITLQSRFDSWRTALKGRPDHHLSTVAIPSVRLPADGITMTTARLVVRDHTGAQLSSGGAKVTVALDGTSSAQLTIGAVADHQNGTYSFSLRAGTAVGTALLRVSVDDGKGPVLLSPRTPVPVTADKLWVSQANLSTATGGNLDFVINQGTANGGRLYILLASNSGTSPGIVVGPGMVFPLNPDPVFYAVLDAAMSNALPGFFGALNTAGRRTIRLIMPPGAYLLPINKDLHFASAVLKPTGSLSNPVAVRLTK